MSHIELIKSKITRALEIATNANQATLTPTERVYLELEFARRKFELQTALVLIHKSLSQYDILTTSVLTEKKTTHTIEKLTMLSQSLSQEKPSAKDS